MKNEEFIEGIHFYFDQSGLTHIAANYPSNVKI